MISIFEEQRFVFFDASAWERFKTKMASGALMSVLEHNSACVALGRTMDLVSDPTIVAANISATASNGIGYYWENWYGKTDPNGALAPVGAPPNRRIPVVGAMVPPADPARRVWWDALAAVLDRMGSRFTLQKQPALPALDTSGQQFVAVENLVGASVVPLSQVPSDGGLLVKEDPDLQTKFGPFITAANAYALRLMNQVGGANDAATAAETAAMPMIQAIANQRAQETRMAQYVGGGIGAGALLASAMFRLLKKGRRRR